jgi:hypothetical protein
VKKSKVTKKNQPLITVVPITTEPKFDALNIDPEDDEIDFVYDIARDWTKKFHRRNYVSNNVTKIEKLIEFANHRKRKDDEGELLGVWLDGQRTWNYLSDCITDFYNGAVKYMHENGITKEMMGLGIKKKRDIEISRSEKKAKKEAAVQDLKEKLKKKKEMLAKKRDKKQVLASNSKSKCLVITLVHSD